MGKVTPWQENRALKGVKGAGLAVPGGPSRFMRGALGAPTSPDNTFGKSHWGSVGISQDLHLNSAIPQAIRERLMTYTLGEGLTPEPHIHYKEAGIPQETARTYEDLITRHWWIWENNINGTWEKSLTPSQLEQLAFSTWLVDGDVFFTIPHVKRPNWPYSPAVKLIDPMLVRTPTENLISFNIESRDLVNGIERDETGADKFYWIANFYADEEDVFNNTKQKHIAYKVYDESTGRRLINHAYSPLRIGQRRGVSFIAPVVELIQASTQLSEAALSSAIVRAYFNVIITDDDRAIDTLSTVFNEHESYTGKGTEIDIDGTPIQGPQDEGFEHDMELGPASIHYIPGNKKITVANPNSESNTFEPFFRAIVMQIGAATGIAYEVLMQHFGQSYSASRAALQMSFKKFLKMRKEWCQIYKTPIYEEFILDLAVRGIIPVSPEEILTNPWVRNIWCNVQWRGPVMESLNPMDEMNAAEKRIDLGLSTREQEARQLSPDIAYTDTWDTWKAETEERASHVSMLNQKYPLNTWEKISTTRTYFDVDEGGGGDIDNPREQLKLKRQQNVADKKEASDDTDQA